MTKWIILFLAILMLMSVYADSSITEIYKPNEVLPLRVHLTNITGEVTGANCSAQIRNSSFGIIVDVQLEEIGGGWYNATYNTSKIGNYNCRYNCTIDNSYSSGTCNFIVEGDDTMSIAVIFVMAIVISVLFLLSRFVRIEALKYLLISIAAIMTVLTLAIGLFLAKDSLPASVQSLMNTAYIVVLYTMDFVLAIGFLFVMFYYVSKWLPEKFRMRK